MWEQSSIGTASFRISGWNLRVEHKPDGLRMTTSLDQSAQLGSLLSLTGSNFPMLAESFIRGDELHLIMPHSNRMDVGLEIALMVIQADDECFILETTLSLQTQSLDSYPGVRLDVAGSVPLVASTKNTARLFSSGMADHPDAKLLYVSVFVDERDQLSIHETTGGTQAIEFFGDFMEKGVIRKVQPWWVWSSPKLSDSQLIKFAESLSRRPLPLTS